MIINDAALTWFSTSVPSSGSRMCWV